jgi:hypothetical protein
MSKPSEFYVGALDLFAILLPGAIASAILTPRIGPLVLGPVIDPPTSAAGTWATFLTCSYFIGHLIFLVGSYLDRFYNMLRERLNPYGNESAYRCATRIRDSIVDEQERSALNTFQWARSVLIATNPTAADDVHRLEADSKFFRSLLIVCGLSVGVFLADDMAAQSLVPLALIPMCFARYYERRLKSTTQAYIHVITMHRLGALGVVPKPELAGSALAQPAL